MVTRRNALRALAGAPAILRAACRAGDKPNLLFLWTDEQRADTLAAYGNPRFHMPSLNRLADQSIVLERCYDTQPVCTPARFSVLTGQWPHASGCITNNIALRRQTKTLPKLLGDAAYHTAYMGKWHLGDEIFAQHGFQQWVSVEDYIYDKYYSRGATARCAAPITITCASWVISPTVPTASRVCSPRTCRSSAASPRSWRGTPRSSSGRTRASRGCCK